MKNAIIIFTVIATVFAGSIFTGCDSPAQNAQEAKANVQDAKQDLKEAQRDAEIAAQKAVNAEEWKTFRTETDAIIKENENRIAELKADMKKLGNKVDAAYSEKVAQLEQKNRDMRTRMDTYEKSQNGWDAFKREFNHDMDALGVAFKDLTVNNKK